MAEKVVRFRELKVGDVFTCDKYNPARDALTIKLKDPVEYTKTGPDTADYQLPGSLQLIFGFSLGFKFSPDVAVRPSNIATSPEKKSKKTEEKNPKGGIK